MLPDVTAPHFESASTYVAGRRETSTYVALRTSRFDWRPPDVVRWTVAPGEWILLGTDGFLDNLGDAAEVSALVRRAVSASLLVTALVDRALDTMLKDPRRGDNLSVVALRALAATESALHPQSPAERESA